MCSGWTMRPVATTTGDADYAARRGRVCRQLAFRSRWLGAQTGRERVQRGLQEKLLDLRTITGDVRADQITGAPATRQDQVTLAVDELAMLALGMPFGRPRPDRTAAEALTGRLERLAAALQSALPPSDAHRPVELPGYPRTQAATELLACAIG
jgi:hypothetical protein